MATKYDPKARKARGIKAGMIAFGAAFAGYALLFPLYRLSDYLLAAGVSVLLAKVISIMAQGPDLRSAEEKKRDAEPLPVTGDAQLDELFRKGQEMLDAIHRENDAIPDEALSRQMDELSRLVRENCDFIMTIPMAGRVNSLNASVAAAILLYEIVRQRHE